MFGNRQPVGWVILLTLTACVGIAAAPRVEEKPAGFFAPLHQGQKVGLKETGNGYQITIVYDVDLGHRIVEIGPDYIVLEDITRLKETRIPIYAIKSITITRLTPPREENRK